MNTGPYAPLKFFPGGMFLTLEGLEASGKTTLAPRLADWYRGLGYIVHQVGEPGGTTYGQAARKLFLERHESLAPTAEVGLLLTCKAQLLHEVVRPAMQRGEIVICDRYTDTLMAYQHHAKGHDREMIWDMIEAFDVDLTPDLTLLIQIQPETSIERSIKRRNEGGDYSSLDAAPLEFHRKVAAGLYTEITRRPDPMFSIVDGEQSRDFVFADAIRRIDQRMAQIIELRKDLEQSRGLEIQLVEENYAKAE